MTIELTTGWLIGLFGMASLCSFGCGVILAFLWIARDGTYQKVDPSQRLVDKKALEDFVKNAETKRQRRSGIPEAGSYVHDEDG